MCKSFHFIYFAIALNFLDSAIGQGTNVIRKASDLKAVWIRTLERSGHEGRKGDFRKEVTLLEHLLTNAPSEVVAAERRRIVNIEVPRFADLRHLDESYDVALLEALVDISLDRKDRSNIVQLLSCNCPLNMMAVPLEFYIEQKSAGNIKLLFESYKVANSSAKSEILFCLADAFPSQRQKFSKDDKFVEEAEKWYNQNRSKLRINNDYVFLPARPIGSESENRGLFLFKGIPQPAARRVPVLK
jgi:hypothetical protein